MDTARLLLDVKEAAHLLSISPWTIRRYIYAGRLRTVRLGDEFSMRTVRDNMVVEEDEETPPERNSKCGLLRSIVSRRNQPSATKKDSQ